MEHILVWLLHQIPQTGWLANNSLFLIIPEAGRAKILVQADLVSGEATFSQVVRYCEVPSHGG